MSVVFREATAADVPAAAALLADDSLGAGREADPHDPAYLRAFEAMQAQRGNRLYVAEADGEVIGCLQLVLMPGLALRGAVRAEIEAVRVRRDRRDGGVGAALVAFAVDRARAGGASLVQLTSNLARPEAHRFWEAQGFMRSHAGFKLAL